MSCIKLNLSKNPLDTNIKVNINHINERDVDTISGSTVLQLTPDMCGTRLDKVISSLLPQYSRSQIQRWIKTGYVTVNGKSGISKMLTCGDETVTVLLQSSSDTQACQAENMPLDVVYEDSDIIVINKPAGLVVHPATGNWSGTLLNGLLFRWPALSEVPRAGIVHRLDKDTSGLMIIAKTIKAHINLVRQMQARTVKRQYLALVLGSPKLNGSVNAPIARHPQNRIKMIVSEDSFAKEAITHYQRLASGLLDRHLVSLMSFRLETGRTHQIRVHMQFIGFSLVGDVLYGKQYLIPIFPRQALQASRLGLIHPTSSKICEWFVPLPDDFTALLARADIDVPE